MNTILAQIISRVGLDEPDFGTIHRRTRHATSGHEFTARYDHLSRPGLSDQSPIEKIGAYGDGNRLGDH